MITMAMTVPVVDIINQERRLITIQLVQDNNFKAACVAYEPITSLAAKACIMSKL